MIPPFRIVISLVPVLAFLGTLLVLDSFKLVTLRSVLTAILAGCVAAFVGMYVNASLMDTMGVSVWTFSRYVAPVSEELLKALYVVYLIKARRAGFLVDAAIYGFAVGAGFSLVENIYYLQTLKNPTLLLWVVRGFGTAVIHGSTAAIFALVAKALADRFEAVPAVVFVPGFGLAVAVHSFYNHFASLLTTLLLFVTLPLAVILVFERSERATRRWLGVGLDTDAELLELILSGEVAGTRIGRHLESLKTRFSGRVVGDLLCLMRIHLELSMRVKGMLLAREMGLKVPVTDDVRANLAELKYLEKSVGRTGKRAILPLLSMSGKELWQLCLLRR